MVIFGLTRLDMATTRIRKAGVWVAKAPKIRQAGVWNTGPTNHRTLNTWAGGEYSDVVTVDAPMAWWRLDELSGTSAVDTIGTNTGTLTSGVTPNVSGISPGHAAMRFDGTQGKISVANPALTGDFSIEGWVYILGSGSVGSTDYSCLLGHSASGSHRILLRNTTGEILCQMGGGDVTATAGTVTLEAWHHLVYTRTGSTQLLYWDGQQVGSLVTAGASLNAAFFIGAFASK